MNENKEHYDALYRNADVSSIFRRVLNPHEFLRDATQTDTSWVGLYYGGFMDRLKGAKILELGAGNGLNALIMAALGANVVAIDISEESPIVINEASKELGLSARIEAIAGDFLQSHFSPDSFDFIVGKAFMHHLTHELEDKYLTKVSTLLKRTGEVRFSEPAVNSKVLDAIRRLVPVSGRPSILSRKRFLGWKKLDPHPERDNSSYHYLKNGRKYFKEVQINPIGGLERFHRILPQGKLNRPFRRYAFKVENHLPYLLRLKIARSQTIILRNPL